MALTVTCLAITFLEFLFLSLGWSVMYPKTNVFQCLLHFVGLVELTLMVLNRFNYTHLRSFTLFFCGIPIVLEIVIGFNSLWKFSIITYNNYRRKIRYDAIDQE